MARLADRYAMLFLAVTVTLATAAWWVTGDPIRAVAVLVVATPCPLILAVPVALVAGLSRAAHFGVLIKGAKPLEALAGIRTLILDKTGTLTQGRPRIVSVQPTGKPVPRPDDPPCRGAGPGLGPSDRAGHRRGSGGDAVAGACGGGGKPGRRRGGASWTVMRSSWAAPISSWRSWALRPRTRPCATKARWSCPWASMASWRGTWSWRTRCGRACPRCWRAAPPRDRAHPAGHGRPTRASRWRSRAGLDWTMCRPG